MAEKLLINVAHEETRVALVESGRLSNFEIVTRRADNNKGNIYKGIVHRVNASLQAAFVDYGAEKQGFLPLGEIIPDLYPKGQQNKKLPIQDVLRQGQEIMVQIVKDEIGNKGAGLTTSISIAGRSLALEANSDKAGVSRRLSDEDRKRLKKELKSLDVPEGHGVIMRTAAAEQDSSTIHDNKRYVEQLLARARERFREQKGPGLVHQERSLPLRSIRDYVSNTVEEIIIDSPVTYEEVRNFCTLVAPDFVNRVKFYDDPRPLFSRYQIEDQIDDIFARRIDLPSGGSIVIDQTEALVAIDVNSGRVKTDDIEDTATKTNLEAAAEIARQLKIRDRGGLIVVDFIDMRERENIRRVEDAVRDAFRQDKAKVKFTKISELGLMEISRQRLQGSVMRGSFTPCTSCGGTGQIRSVESSALYLLRRMKETLLRGNHQHIEARIPVDIANYLLNRKRRELVDLERQTGASIEVKAEASCPPMQAYFELLSRPANVSRRPKRVLQKVDLVRSEVERRELDENEEVRIAAAVSREAEISPFADAREQLDVENRELEAKLARAKEVERAQQEADASLRREAQLKAKKELLLAEAERIRALERARWKGMSIWGRLKALFGGGLPPLTVEDEDDKPEEATSAPERADRDERRRRRSRDEPREERRRRRDRDGERKGSGERRERPTRSERTESGKSERSDKRERSEHKRRSRGERGDRELIEAGGATPGEGGEVKKKRRRRRRSKSSEDGEATAANASQTKRRSDGGRSSGEKRSEESADSRGRDERRDRRQEPRRADSEKKREAPATETDGQRGDRASAKSTPPPVPETPKASAAGGGEPTSPPASPKLPKFGAIDLRSGSPKVVTPRPAAPSARPAEATTTPAPKKEDAAPAKKADAAPAEKADAKPAEKADAKPAEKADAKPAEKADAKPAEKADAKPAEKADAKPAKAADAKPTKIPAKKTSRAKRKKKDDASGQAAAASKGGSAKGGDEPASDASEEKSKSKSRSRSSSSRSKKAKADDDDGKGAGPEASGSSDGAEAAGDGADDEPDKKRRRGRGRRGGRGRRREGDTSEAGAAPAPAQAPGGGSPPEMLASAPPAANKD